MSTTISINSEIQEQVTPILNALGISVSEAVNMFLHQVTGHVQAIGFLESEESQDSRLYVVGAE